MKLHTTTSTALGLSAALLATTPAVAKTAAQWLAITAPVQIGMQQAVQSALAAAPGQVIEADLKAGKKGAVPYYQVTVVSPQHDEIKLRVNAATGAAQVQKNKGKAAFRHEKRLTEAQVNLVQAVDAAVAHTPGKPLEAKLDSDWGQTRYKVLLLQADKVVSTVKLDAVSGKVTDNK